MPEVLVLCEGQTEREFCRSVLREYVAPYAVHLAGTLVGKPQRKRGGIRPWSAYRAELLRLAAARPERYVAVLVDYYGMPDSWPGRIESRALPAVARGIHVEQALRRDLREQLGARFIPCVQLHEFESLLFVEPELSALSISVGTGKPLGNHADRLAAIRDACGGNIEAINDGPNTSPARRLKHIFPAYDKVAWGVLAARDAGVQALRHGCPWLDRWLRAICALACE